MESIDHILQKCVLTHDVRCARHNRLVTKIAQKLRRKGHETWTEPIIPTGRSFCKPDLICKTKEEVFVMDVAVASGHRMEAIRQEKITKYDTEEINQNIRELTNGMYPKARVKHCPLVWSTRGLLDQRSGDTLRELKVDARTIENLCFTAVCGSIKCYDLYMIGH